MEIVRYESVEEFLSATKSFRGQDSVRTGLITSIATSVAQGKRTYEGYFWWSVNQEGEIAGLAIRTLPYGYVFSPMSNEAASKLMSAIELVDSDATEFAGPKSVIDYIEEIRDFNVSESESELIYSNEKLIEAPQVGSTREAIESDYDLIFSWMQKFIEETGLRNFNLDLIVKSAIEEGRYTLLMVDGEAVCLGGNTEIQDVDGFKIARVGPIYTPHHHRKKGYASSITSVITKKLIAQGALPTLYTQAENPTSNKIYQEIGYTLVDENRRIVFKR